MVHGEKQQLRRELLWPTRTSREFSLAKRVPVDSRCAVEDALKHRKASAGHDPVVSN